MNRRSFKFTLTDEVIRGMTRQQYKAASHWIRWCAWKVSKRIKWDKVNKHISGSLIYGRSIVCYKDLLI